jgi:hypothetical protein
MSSAKILIFTCLLLSSQLHAIEKDKQLHFGVSLGITLLTYGLFHAILSRDGREITSGERVGMAALAGATAFAAGLLKETTDRQADGSDIVANGGGALAGYAAITLLEF